MFIERFLRYCLRLLRRLQVVRRFLVRLARRRCVLCRCLRRLCLEWLRGRLLWSILCRLLVIWSPPLLRLLYCPRLRRVVMWISRCPPDLGCLLFCRLLVRLLR